MADGLMNEFEKIIPIDSSIDEMQGWEKVVRIEKSDMEYFISKEPDMLKEREKDLGIKNEKSKSKTTKRKTKKNDSKIHQPAVESLQEKLS